MKLPPPPPTPTSWCAPLCQGFHVWVYGVGIKYIKVDIKSEQARKGEQARETLYDLWWVLFMGGGRESCREEKPGGGIARAGVWLLTAC